MKFICFFKQAQAVDTTFADVAFILLGDQVNMEEVFFGAHLNFKRLQWTPLLVTLPKTFDLGIIWYDMP